MKIGFTRLRIIGKPMSKNLIKAEYAAAVYGCRQDVLDERTELGSAVHERGKYV